MLKKNDTWKAIGWIGALFVIFGYYLNANQYSLSWIIWILGNLMVGMYSLTKKAYSTAIMSFIITCLLYTSPSPRDVEESRMPSSA